MERDPVWTATIGKLYTAYKARGRAALEAMSGVEPLALWSEKVREYKALGKQLDATPQDDALRRQRGDLLHEINDIGDWLNAKIKDQNAEVKAANKGKSQSRDIDLEV